VTRQLEPDTGRFWFLGVGALYEVLNVFLVADNRQDTIVSLPRYPEEDQKQRASAATTRLGGNIPNTLNVLRQVKRDEDRLVFISTFANWEASRRLTDQLVQKGIEVGGVWLDCPQNPQSWILKSEQSGSRTIVNYNGYIKSW
jgi:ketohexokinase